jgi:predicted protein tyrosine phosphatase
MQKGLRRKAAALILEKIGTKVEFEQVLAHAPAFPFPAAEMLPQCYVPLMPSSVRPETNQEHQTDFRFAIVIILDIGDDMDLRKCDLIDAVEEAIQELQVDPVFQADFSQIEIEQVDPGPLSLSVFGFEPLIVAPPVGAVRIDGRVDFHYAG